MYFFIQNLQRTLFKYEYNVLFNQSKIIIKEMKKIITYPQDCLESIFKIMRIKNYQSNDLHLMGVESITTLDDNIYIYKMSDDYYHGWLDKYIPKNILEKLRWIINTTEFDDKNRIIGFELRAKEERIIFVCKGSLEFMDNGECVLICDDTVRIGYAGVTVPSFISSFLLKTLPKRIIDSMENELQAALNTVSF